MSEYITPEFLQHSSVDERHKVMLDMLPKDLDVSEGGHAWNMTRPTALLDSELREFILPEVIKLIFPEWSYGQYLDEHARYRSMSRRKAVAASGEITVTGTAGTFIQAGSLFFTAAVNDEPSVDYQALYSVVIPDGGSVKLAIQCTKAGIIGNTPANTIVMASSSKGITAVTNEQAITGGTEVESDESLIQRILEYDQTLGESFVGSISDYKRWATSVPGVGSATIIPAQDDTGMVTIIITDANGATATEQLCTEVYNYIMSPDAPEDRRAPINANINVTPPETISIGIKATVEISDGATLGSVKEAYLKKLALYLPVALDEGEIKYTRIAAALSSVDGANDFSDLQFGIKSGGTVTYGTSNISISSIQLPTISVEDLILTSGTV